MHCRTLTILNLLSLVSPAISIWPFPPKRFSGNSLIDAGSMGLDPDGRVIAFGDFNGDQFLDIVSLGRDQQTLSIYLWNHEDFYFQRSTSLTHPRRIYNVVPGDFTHDGMLDLLVMSESSTRSQLDMSLYLGSLEGRFDTSNPLSIPPSSLSQPIPIDANGDMKIDILGIPSLASSFKVWQNVWNASQPHSPLFDIVNPNFVGSQCKTSNPHSNAVVDLNGDCLADIFIVCEDSKTSEKSFQIWVNDKGSGFSLAQTGKLPSGVEAISFADMDRDGTIDMVFTTCGSVSPSTGIGIDCYINIAYNKQLPLCSSSTASGLKDGKRICRPPDQLCTADPNFSFDLSEREDNDAFVRFPISELFSLSATLIMDTSHTPPLPIPLKLGDTNLNGFPDLLAIIVSPEGHHTPRLMLSVPCARGVVGCAANGSGRRGWRVLKQGVASLNDVTDARGATFLDMDEDGTLDVMVQRTGKQGKGTILFVQNNFYYDAFFLKAIVLNSACDNGWCLDPKGKKKFHPFGASSGATYKYTVLDTSGRRSAAQVGQLPQTSYHSLLTPYSFFGLGRTNNYIENLFVGSTKHIQKHFINMEGVIPNSKVVILPPPEGQDGWKRELFLRPGEWIPWVTLTVVLATVVLAVIVFVLHLNEKREDELERRRASHHINFDAL